jgi:hypothetical protein
MKTKSAPSEDKGARIAFGDTLFVPRCARVGVRLLQHPDDQSDDGGVSAIDAFSVHPKPGKTSACNRGTGSAVLKTTIVLSADMVASLGFGRCTQELERQHAAPPPFVSTDLPANCLLIEPKSRKASMFERTTVAT